jgi:type III secretion system FlhB-like substrate exporter
MNPEMSADEVEARASARARRQEILRSDDAPKVWAIVNEAVLRRVVGSAETMKVQMQALADLAEDLPNVTVQVLAFDAGAHASQGYSFSLLTFEDVPGSIIYSEGITSATYLDKQSELSRHEDIFQRLVAASERPEKSIAMIRNIAEEFSHAG